MNIAFFGAGLMGAGFVRRMLENGHQVNVWNRDPAKATALEIDGAHAFADAAEAIKDVERIHLSLSDDDAVDSVLEPLADADPGLDLSSSTTRRPRRRRRPSGSRAGPGGAKCSSMRRCS